MVQTGFDIFGYVWMKEYPFYPPLKVNEAGNKMDELYRVLNLITKPLSSSTMLCLLASFTIYGGYYLNHIQAKIKPFQYLGQVFRNQYFEGAMSRVCFV